MDGGSTGCGARDLRVLLPRPAVYPLNRPRHDPIQRRWSRAREVLYSRDGMMLVGIDYPAFRKLKAGRGERREVRVGDHRLSVVDELPAEVVGRLQSRAPGENAVDAPLFALDFARYWGGTGEGTCLRVRPAVHPLLGAVYGGPGAALPVVPVGTPVVLGRPGEP